MNGPNPPMLRVRNWDQIYENNRSRGLKRTDWFPAPNDLSADGYVELVAHEQGAAHFGIWNAVLMVASRTKPRRGLLAKEDGRPHTPESLARVTRLHKALIKDALQRLLEIGLLEVAEGAPTEIINLPLHPGAGKPQEPAGKQQEGAIEGKGTEHHHQEEKRKEKKGTERAGYESKPVRSSGASTADFCQRRTDDEKNPGEVYDSPEDELKAIYLAKAGEPITIAVLDVIRLNLELNRVTMGEFVSGLKTHLAGNWKNPAGFLCSLSRNFLSKSQPAADPVTAAEAADRNYRCPLCHSTVRGEGVVLGPNGKPVPCSCASPEYIERQRGRGVFAKETAQ